MKILIDTREKKIDHIKEYFDNNGIEYEQRNGNGKKDKGTKLDVGDYIIEGFQTLVIDRKQNLDEVMQNLASKDDSRFWRELRRSKENGIKLIFLVEHSRNIKSLSDVVNFKSHWSKVSGRELAQKMWNVHVAYNVDWEFCDKRHTAERILELLCYDQRRNT